MTFTNEEISMIAREAAEDIRFFLRITAANEESAEHTKNFNAMFDELLDRLDKLSYY